MLTGTTRRIATVCLLVVMATALRAEAQDTRVGIRVGPTFGFLSNEATPFSGGTAETNANLRLDLHVGAHMIAPLTDHIALQPELLFLQKGGHFSQPFSQRYAVERYRLSYLQGTLLGRGDLPIPALLSAHIVVGLSVDLALEGVVHRNMRTAETNFADRVALMETGSLQRWDVGGILGAGMGYPIGAAGRLSLEVRYNPGFRSVFARSDRSGTSLPDAEDVFPLSRSKLRHDVVTASLSYTLPLASLF